MENNQEIKDESLNNEGEQKDFQFYKENLQSSVKEYLSLDDQIKALNKANQSILVKSPMFKWTINKNPKIKVIDSYSKIHDYIVSSTTKFDIVLIMSNKSTQTLRDELQK